MIELTFWGVRGSNPVSGKAFEKLGGNTSCVSVRVNKEPLIIFDAGSGLYDLGKKLSTETPSVVHMFISHLHLDHVMGLPFFAPLWDKKWAVNVYSQDKELESTLRNKLLCPPLFPVQISSSNSNLIFHLISPDETLSIESSKIKMCTLHHPGSSYGYRLDAEGHVICYITDVEYDAEHRSDDIIEFVRGCDLLIYDTSYTEEEYQSRQGWGHSTHLRGAEIAKASGVKKLALFHQDPLHDDKMSDQVELEAQKIFPETFAARQGLKLHFV